jgi:hypothetical protein
MGGVVAGGIEDGDGSTAVLGNSGRAGAGPRRAIIPMRSL